MTKDLMPRLNEARVRLWCEWLRSGRFTQGTRRLRDDGSYCCLGVLCSLHDDQTGKDLWDFDPASVTHDGNEQFPSDTVLSWAFGAHAGFPAVPLWAIRGALPEDVITKLNDDPQVALNEKFGDEGYMPVHMMNDHMQLTFDQIADVLEHYLDNRHKHYATT